MVSTGDVQRYAGVIMTMIKEDQDSGQVPRGVSSWDELDDCVDTNDYCRLAGMPAGTPEAGGLRDAVEEEVGRRLAASQGGQWHVTWTRPDGRAENIGRTLGYPTRSEAETVGRRYLAAHGGGYRVDGG